MDRRSFLHKLPMLAGTAFSLQHIPMRVIGKNSELANLASQSTNDRVLIILQLSGGNDGLNTFIPIEQYDQYYSRRANIAIPAKNSIRSLIPLDSTLATPDQVGLHPDMIDVKDLYDRGRMTMIQGVSYPNNNGSHFRGRDIWHMGGGPDDYLSSGWIGRFIKQEIDPLQYPENFPNAEHPDPLAIEMGNDLSLVFHQENNIPLSISLGSSPDSLANMVDQLEGFVDEGFDPRGKPPAFLDNSRYGREMNWILGLEDKSEDYVKRLYEVYSMSSASTVTYPEKYPFNAPKSSLRNRLSPQLQMIARLLDGGGAGQGVNTKVFLVKLGGFDTHAAQTESYDPTMGSHAALLHHISSAMKAFQEDLRVRGLEDRVLTITTSEFGRRIGSNGAYGTDHGTGGPMMVFGSGIQPGVIGTNPDVTEKNVSMQYDYRQIYAHVLTDWFEVDPTVVQNNILFGDYINGTNPDGGAYSPLPLIRSEITSNEGFFTDRFFLSNASPNPVVSSTTIRFRINRPSEVSIILYDMNGRPAAKLLNESKTAGDHQVTADLSHLPSGLYIYELKAGMFKDSKRLVIK